MWTTRDMNSIKRIDTFQRNAIQRSRRFAVGGGGGGRGRNNAKWSSSLLPASASVIFWREGYVGLVARKPVFRSLRPADAQTSLLGYSDQLEY